jgi:hypothetical protein
MSELLHKPAQHETLLLWGDLNPLAACVFCGSAEEGRYMCSKCRRVPLVEMFWLNRR